MLAVLTVTSHSHQFVRLLVMGICIVLSWIFSWQFIGQRWHFSECTSRSLSTACYKRVIAKCNYTNYLDRWPECCSFWCFNLLSSSAFLLWIKIMWFQKELLRLISAYVVIFITQLKSWEKAILSVYISFFPIGNLFLASSRSGSVL